METRRIAFTVYGNPLPKSRPRVVRLPNGRVHTFTPGATKAWEESIQGQALAYRPERLLDGPLALTVIFHLLRPKSLPKKRRWPDKRPDLDNLLKSVKDALNGVIWRDDAQIITLDARKYYGDAPSVEVIVEELEEGCA